jgi:WS/DGAT/MGAT family acyltransferase
VLELPREALGGAATLARLLALPADPPSPLRGPLQVEKRAAWCRPVDLDRVKRLARSTGGTVNDVLLAVAAGALRRHVLLQGGQPNDLRVGMPVNLRGPGRPVPSELGNHFGLVLLTLPLSEADPVERVRLVTAESRRFKAGRDAVFTAGLMNAAGLLPRSVTEAVLNSLGTRCSAIVTNVPGPTSSVSIAGAEVSEIVFWVPQLAGIAVGVSVFSYAGRVSLGVAADATVLPRPQAVADAMAAELDAMDAALVVDLDADPDPGTAGRDAGSLAMRRQA